MKAILIPVEGVPRAVEQNGLDDLQALVKGMIDAVDFPLRPDLTVYINDEGKFLFEKNIVATRLLELGLSTGDWIAGPCVVCGFDSSQGKNLEVPADAMDLVKAAAAEVYGSSVKPVPGDGAAARGDKPIVVKARDIRRTDVAWHKDRRRYGVVSRTRAWPERGEVQVCFLYDDEEVPQVFAADERVRLKVVGVNAQRVIDRLCVPEGQKAGAWTTERFEDHMFHAGSYPVINGHEFVAALGAWEEGGHVRLLPDGGSFPYSFSLAADMELAMIDYCEGDIGVRVYDDKEPYIRALDIYGRGPLDSDERRAEHEQRVARALRTGTYPGTVEFESFR